MFTAREMASSDVVWMERIQNEMFRQMTAYMEEHGLTKSQVSKQTGISKVDVRVILDGEFNGTLEEMIVLMLKIDRVPNLSFHSIDEEVKRREPYQPLLARNGRDGKYFQMQDVLLACGELNKRERVAIAWLLGKANELHDAYEKERMKSMR